MNKHTPGPWNISKLATPDYAPEFAIYAGLGPAVARVINENSHANATLLAASPDMLQALIVMCAEFRALDLPYGSKAYAQANEAIRQATSLP